AYREELVKQRRSIVLLLSGTSLIGGVLGAELLLSTSQSTFVKLLPYLLLVATVLFALSGPITTRLRSKTLKGGRQSWLTLVGIAMLQLIIAIYGGYFGGGIGILMLATLGLMGMENIHEMNAMKTLLTTFINGVAVIIFVIRGVVVWPQAILMVVGAIIGGYAGAYFARKIDQRWVRGFVIVVGVSMTIYFFLR
ncbi:MAG TPA: sulfite exporter TauE/SafE family protein, partial [Ktedonobacteraceae bacterium]